MTARDTGSRKSDCRVADSRTGPQVTELVSQVVV